MRFVSLPCMVVAALSLAACRTVPSTRALDVADEQFTGRRDTVAADAYARAMREATDSDEELRAELFSLLARRAAVGSATPESAAAVAALADFAAGARSTAWGRAADVVLDEIKRGDVLSDALLRAGAERQELEQQDAKLAADLAAAQASLKAQEAELAGLREERTQLVQRNRDLDEALKQATAHESALSAELAALKQIDLQHVP